MEFSIDELIQLLLNLKEKTKWNDTATIYLGKKNGASLDVIDVPYLCAEETVNGVNVPLFKISSQLNYLTSEKDSFSPFVEMNPNLESDLEDAEKQELL